MQSNRRFRTVLLSTLAAAVLAWGLPASSVLARQDQQTPGLARSSRLPSISLVARNVATDRAAIAPQALSIETLDARVDVRGSLAITTLTIRFANPSGLTLEGDFSLALPADAKLIGYGLDINGAIIDGVLQPALVAREAYEDVVRRGVDPGLAEIAEDGRFVTRVFPIQPQSGRTIRVSYVTPINLEGTLVLPLDAGAPIGEVRASITTDRPNRVPVTLPAGMADRRHAQHQTEPSGQGQATAEGQFSGRGVAGGALVIAGLRQENRPVLSQHRSGQAFFEFTLTNDPSRARRSEVLALYWDVSRARHDDDLAREIDVAASTVQALGPGAVEIITFADGLHRPPGWPRPMRKACALS